MGLLDVCGGYALDMVIGDPVFLPHPVQAMGWCIERGETWLRPRVAATPWGERFAGGILTVGICGISWVGGKCVVSALGRKNARLTLVLRMILAASTLATQSLLHEASAVELALRQQNLPLARQRVARIVGRDTIDLNEAGIARAAIESVAESLCDAIAMPLCALALGGVPLALACKAVSTLDSMIGHREQPYTYFGTFAARLDDCVNYIPARLCALLLSGIAPLWGASAGAVLTAVGVDAAHHASPNSGYPETAMAALLGVSLGGPLAYDGIPTQTAVLNAQGRLPTCDDLATALRVTATASLFFAFGAALGLGIWRYYGRR